MKDTVFKQEQGFTLIELMAVLAILTMLVLIAVPAIGSITKKAEAQADDATISMIEKAGGLALLGDVAYDDPVEEQYDVVTLVEEGYLDIDESHKYAESGNMVTRVKGHEFEFEPARPATDVAFFDMEELPNGTVRITKYHGTDTDVVIPETFDGKIVSEIGNYSFRDNQLTSVVIPDSVVTIGEFAFASNQLTSVVIPDSVVTIGRYAFASNQLTSVVIPENLTVIQYAVFYNNQITSVVIPDGVTTIEDAAFSKNQLTHVDIPNSVKTIGIIAFSENQIMRVEIPRSVTSFAENAFYQNPGVTIIRH